MAELFNDDPRRRSALWLKTLTVLYLLTLTVWRFVFNFVSRVAADQWGPVPPIPGDPVPVLLARAYPVVVILGLVVAWVLHSRQLYPAAVWVSLLPLANLFLVFLALALLAQGYALVYLS